MFSRIVSLTLVLALLLTLYNMFIFDLRVATPLEAFSSVANQLLQDAQERLVFRAHLYLQSDILNYNPSAGDLAYPEKLEMMEVIPFV